MNNPDKTAKVDDLTGLLHDIARLTEIIEIVLHDAVLSCTRARRQMAYALPVTKPVFH